MTRFFCILAALAAIPACASQSDDSAPLTGVIGGQPFTSVSAALIDLPPDITSDYHEIWISDFNLCGDPQSGDKQNSAYAILYIAKTASPGTFPLLDDRGDATAELAVHRLDSVCDEVTDEYAKAGAVTVSELSGSNISGTISNATAKDDPEAGDTNQLTGSFEVTCEVPERTRTCRP